VPATTATDQPYVESVLGPDDVGILKRRRIGMVGQESGLSTVARHPKRLHLRDCTCQNSHAKIGVPITRLSSSGIRDVRWKVDVKLSAVELRVCMFTIYPMRYSVSCICNWGHKCQRTKDDLALVLLLAVQPALACAIPTTQEVIVWHAGSLNNTFEALETAFTRETGIRG
jgi:hypothetical protein